MKNLKFITIFFSLVLLIGCKSDDDSNEQGDAPLEIPEGNIFLSSQTNSNTTILDIATGQQASVISEPFYKPTIYQNSTLYFTNDNLVRASSIGGEEMWRTGFREIVGNRNEFNESKPVIIGNTVYVTYRSLNLTTFESIYYLEAFDFSNGNALLTLTEQSETISDITTFDDALVTLEFTPEILIRKRDKSTGAILNEISVTNNVQNFFVSGNSLIVFSRNNTIISLDESLNENWRYTTGGNNGVFGILDGNSFVYYSYDQKIESLDIASGNLNWTVNIPNFGAKGLKKYQDKYIAAQTVESSLNLFTIEPSNGNILDTTTFELEPDNQFDDFGITFFEGNVFFVQGFNSSRDPVLTMGNIKGDIYWSRDFTTSFSNLWLLKTSSGSYTNDQVF